MFLKSKDSLVFLPRVGEEKDTRPVCEEMTEEEVGSSFGRVKTGSAAMVCDLLSKFPLICSGGLGGLKCQDLHINLLISS